MAKLARDVMTRKPARCSPDTTLDVVARLMVQNNCGQIPVVDSSDQVIGVITDRDIVSRVVAKGINPLMHTAESCMSFPVVTLPDDTPLEDVISAMEGFQIRRVPVVDDEGCCAGMISQADVVFAEPPKKTAELLCELSRDKGRASSV